MKDVSVPDSLKELQTWFGGVITQSIDEESRICPIAPSGHSIEDEAKRYIRPNQHLNPAQRIEIYNQQYWWRLLNIMHENFPLLTSLFGHFDFNHSLAVPYLQRYPPNHWSLNTLGDTLPEWIETYYVQDDKQLVYESALLDISYNLSFTAGNLPLIAPDVNTLKKKVTTQPHLFLIPLTYDLIPFRAEVLKNSPEYYADNNFPKLNKKKHHIALYRDPQGQINCRETLESEYLSLLKFKEGISVEEFCDWIETLEDPIIRDAQNNLIIWFQEWTSRGWLGLPQSLQEKQPI